MQRFEALDSWRGLCALLVVVFHLNQAIAWDLHNAAFIRNFALFVDFFFVLSGFVIAGAYEDRLKQGYGAVAFAIRRFGRLYPLHIATLAVMIVFALARVPLTHFNPRAAFDGDIFDFSAIFTNLLLVHGIGFENHLTWNYPSWSISAEFYTYLIFAGIWSALARWAGAVTLGLALICPLLLIAFPEPTVSVMTLVRCVYGFAAGVLVQRLRKTAPTALADKRLAIAAEIAAVALCVWFVGFTDGAIWAAPLVFASVVYVFAFEAGPIAALLRWRPFTGLGTLSYSIYMVHAVLIAFGWRAVTLMERNGAVVTSHDATGTLWATTPIAGDLTMAAMLALVVCVSVGTYAWIEKPGRPWGVRASQRWRDGGIAALFGAKRETAPL